MKVSFIVGRAVLAVVLMIGFYLLAVGIAAGLLWIPYAEVVYAHHVTPKLALICILGGLAILWSVLPRIDKFAAPGPKLTPEKYPKLFAELKQVANATQQEMPAEVYLVPDVNAWVMQRGGVMGFGSRRVMGLGLPLMRILTCAQFRAVLAHEFGHYHGGDTKIGPWIYKTRGAIGRTVASLGHKSLLQAPFRWYGKMFLRITHAVSRRQEFVADELAARTIGSKPLSDGLCSVHKVGPVYNYYWRSECAPVLSAGFLPPLSDGFSQFVTSPEVAEKMDKDLKEQLASGKVNPYDTHPPLKDRIAAVASLPPGPALEDDPPAASLLGDVPGLERDLILQLAGADQLAKLKPILWNDVGAQVYVPQWTKLAQINALKLKGITPESLPMLAAGLKKFGVGLLTYSSQPPGEQNAEGLAHHVIGAILCLLLIQRGGQLNAGPGVEVSVALNGRTMEPFTVIPLLKDGKKSTEEWMKECEEIGIAGVDLGVVAANSEEKKG